MDKKINTKDEESSLKYNKLIHISVVESQIPDPQNLFSFALIYIYIYFPRNKGCLIQS